MILSVIVGLESHSLTAWERDMIDRVQPAGYILFSRNIDSVEQTRALTDELRARSKGFHPIVAIDQEGGRVVRTAALGLNLPGAADLASLGKTKAIVETAVISARTLHQLGINTNFAPVLDLASPGSEANALPSRCWGYDPQQVLSYAGVFNRNQRHHHIMTCGKHFPGMGRATCDPHFDLPVIHGTMDDFMHRELIPFSALDRELSGIMLAHTLLPDIDPDNPASLSKKVIFDFLRQRLDYKGIIYTDDVCMGAITKTMPPHLSVPRALEAGCDLPLVCHQVCDVMDGIVAGIQSIESLIFKDSRHRVEDHVHRIHAPVAYTPATWNRLLQQAEQLCREVPSAAEIPNSPVQQY